MGSSAELDPRRAPRCGPRVRASLRPVRGLPCRDWSSKCDDCRMSVVRSDLPSRSPVRRQRGSSGATADAALEGRLREWTVRHVGSRECSAESARGFVLSSTDARSWKLVHQGQDERLVSITHTGDAWYTAGAVVQNSKATTLLLRSEDGIVWDRATPPVAAPSLLEVFWTGKLLLAVAREGDFGTGLYHSDERH